MTEEELIKYENECKNHLKELSNIHECSFRKKFQIDFNSLFTSNGENIENFIISNIGTVSLKETEVIEVKSEGDVKKIVNEENLIQEEEDTVVDLIGLNIEQQAQNNITIIPSSSSSSSSSSTPTIESPLNLRRKYKTNLSIVKEAGIWGGDENVEFW